MSTSTKPRLSLLQQTILRLGFSNRQHQKKQRDFDVTRAEVLSGYYGWLVTHGYPKIVFSRYSIGPARYNSAHVSLTKALQRLRKRGLLRLDTWRGAKLTSAGITAAKTLPEWKA